MTIPDTISIDVLTALAAKASHADIEAMDAKEYRTAAQELIADLTRTIDRMDRMRLLNIDRHRVNDFAMTRKLLKKALRHIKRSINT